MERLHAQHPTYDGVNSLCLNGSTRVVRTDRFNQAIREGRLDLCKNCQGILARKTISAWESVARGAKREPDDA